MPIDFAAGHPAEQVRQMRSEQRNAAAHRDEEAVGDVTCGSDAVGVRARHDKGGGAENRLQAIAGLATVVNPVGHIGIIGLLPASDHGGDPMLTGGDLPGPKGRCSATG